MSYLLLAFAACAPAATPHDPSPAPPSAPAADDERVPAAPVPPTTNARMAGVGPNGPPGADLNSKTNQLGIEPTYTTNPTDGAQIAYYVDMPEGSGPFPTLVFANGSTHAASEELKPQRTTPFIKAGFGLVYFDAEGRGNSGGTENVNGEATQDAFAQVVREIAKDPRVDPKRIAVASYSLGVATVTGALARHPDLPAKFYIDWEGPASREFIAGCGDSGRPTPGKGTIPWGDCNDDSWWKPREAAEQIGKIKIPYWRLQYAKDHVQPDYGHTLLMVQNAEKAGVRVRLNDMGESPKVKTDADIVPLDMDIPVVYKVLEYAHTWMNELTDAKMPELAPAPRVPGGGRPQGPPGRGQGGGQRPR